MADFCPTEEKICITRGDSPVISLEITDESGNTLDITGYSFILTVDPSPDPADASNNLFQVSIPALASAPSGRVQFQPSVTQTDQDPGEYFYDIQVTTPTPSVRTLKAGVFEIRQDITKT